MTSLSCPLRPGPRCRYKGANPSRSQFGSQLTPGEVPESLVTQINAVGLATACHVTKGSNTQPVAQPPVVEPSKVS